MTIALLFIFGLAIGSFINVVVIRTRAGITWQGRSRCLTCQRQLAWYHNIPVVSFLFLRRRCAYCHQLISWQYPVVEILTAVLFAFSWILSSGWGLWSQLAVLFMTSSAIIFLVYDWRYQLLPDSVTIGGAVVLLILNWLSGRSLIDLLVGAVLASGFFAIQYFISRGTWIGLGDVYLGLWLGVALGLKQTIVALLLAYWLGALVGIALLLGGRVNFKSRLPLGVFLTIATWISWFWGQVLANWYLAYLNF